MPFKKPIAKYIRRFIIITLPLFLALFFAALSASETFAEDLTISFTDGLGLTDQALQIIALITILSLAPSILVMITSFTRVVIVLSLLRTAMGVQTSPPNSVIISLALFLTAFIMAPVFEIAYETGIKPLTEGTMELQEAFENAIIPFKQFMLANVRDKDLRLFLDIAQQELPETPEDVSTITLIPAFMISELRRAFEIGFLIFIPFIVIDMVVASILMSMGMMMLPPVIISLPFKLIFFVLVDGWNLVTGSLVQSFGANLTG
ncbi:MAG: flagellar type III secretion system pore protein FliP [OCS116 cluster bacterium]|uniref:Flagellar biosynthetic protein FliP n=1 Tax=OCS116 cluster bacterium TaxID=2030921 RepID=A0A2A4Z161_9PROT|nr:flagellar type III secretion system pore protein FliP [OCS116 cluster bacterium]